MRVSTVVVRCIMGLFWAGVILCFLFAPTFFSLFHSYETRSISLYVPPLLIDPKKVGEFQTITGIKVHMHYYESNEELLQKLYVTNGRGYDLVMAVDYVVDVLREKKLIQMIDHAKLGFWSQLRPSLLHYYYDSENTYSVPYFLSVYGLGIDPLYFGGTPPKPTWGLLFSPHGYKVALTDVPRRALAIASYFLYGSTQALLDPIKRKAVEQLLIDQKAWVSMYTDIRGEDLLATKNCPVVMTIASDLWMIKREYPHLEFQVPEEGTFVTIDSLVIPVASNKQTLIYEFLNYLYQPENIAYSATRYGFCPPVIDADISGYGIFCPTKEQIQKFNFFKNTIPSSVLNDMWISIMSH